MTDNNEVGRRPGASALGHVAIRTLSRARAIFVHGIVDLVAIMALIFLMSLGGGNGNGVTILAIAMVVGGEIWLRRHEKKRGGEQTVRGTQVEDHTHE